MATTDTDLEAFQQRLRSATLTRSQHRIAQVILDTPERIALSTLGQLSEELGINQSTIARFCSAVEVPGYSELRALCKRLCTVRETMLSRFLSNGQNGSDEAARRSEVANDDRTSIAATFAGIEDDRWAVITELLSSAHTVGVVGVRQSYSPAVMLSYLLGLVRGNVTTLSELGSLNVDALRAFTQQDVIVAISTYPCSSATVQTVRWARERGIPVISITDVRARELIDVSDHVLLAETTGPSVLSSMTAIITVVQALVDAVSRIDPERTEQSLRQENELLQFFSVHSTSLSGATQDG
jgi:DNA-binding MurR/RpiR family transcriptional regulator